MSSPQESSSWYQWIFFTWVSPTVDAGGEKEDQDKQLLISDIAQVPFSETARQAREDFRPFWDEKYEKMCQEDYAKEKNKKKNKKQRSRNSTSNTQEQDQQEEDDTHEQELPLHLYEAFIEFQKRPLIISGILHFLSDACKVAIPFLLREFCIYIFDASRPAWEGWPYVAGLAICALLGAFLLNLSAFYLQTAFETMRSVLKILVFDKALEYESNHDFVGQLTAAHASDTDKVFSELAHWYHVRWAGFLFAIELFIALAVIAGPQALLLVPIVLFVLVIQAYLVTVSFAHKEIYMSFMDRRTSMLSELLQSIRVVKFQAWEDAFEKSISAVRALEVAEVGKIKFFIALVLIISSLLTYGMYIANYAFVFEFGILLTPAVAFPSAAVMTNLSIPLMAAAVAHGYYLDARHALRRIQTCLVGREKQDYVEKIYNSDDTQIVAEMKNVTVLGSQIENEDETENENENEHNHKDEITKNLQDTLGEEQASDPQQQQQQSSREIVAPELSLKIHRGKLTIVLGNVGEGKSVLLSALLGEAAVDLDSKYRISGKEEDRGFVRHYTPLAYVPQEKYITNATVKENITLVRKDNNNSNIDEERYQKTIDVCQLRGDLEEFMYGDDTEIGTSGSSVTISGGQSQRVSIARACYSNREFVVLDDALSALDPHVAHNLFEECILGMLMKEKKSVVLVTHMTQFLPRADRVVLMNDCRIVFDGTLEEFKNEGYSVEEHQQQEDNNDQNQNQNQNEENFKQDNSTTSSADASPMEKAETETLVVVDEENGENKKDDKGEEKDTVAVEVDVAGGASQLMTNEDRQTGSINLSTYFWYIRGGGVIWFALLVAMLFFAFTANSFFNIILAAWSTKQQIDSVLRQNLSVDTTLVTGDSDDTFEVFSGLTDRQFLMWMGIFYSISCSFHLIRSLTVYKFFTNASLAMHSQFLHSVISAPMYWIETVPLARILNRFSSDVVAFDFQVADQVMFCLNLFAILWGASLVMAISSPFILLALVPLFIYFVLVFIKYGKAARGCKRLESTARSPMMALMSELTSTSGLSSIRAYGIEDQLKERHLARVEISSTPIYNMRILDRWLTTRTELIGFIIIIAVGGLGVLARHLNSLGNNTSNAGKEEEDQVLTLTPGLVCAAMTVAIESSPLFSSLTKYFSQIETEMSSTERIKEYSDSIPQEVRMVYNSEISNSNNNEPSSSHHELSDFKLLTVPSSTPLPRPSPTWPFENPIVEFRNVSLRYRENLPLVCKNVSFTFKPRSKNALVGKSGSGKSTILAALDRLVEISSGQILIDGRDVTRDLDIRDLRKRITVIPQDPILFSGTLRSNLDVFGEHTDEELWAVLDKLELRKRFEGGLASLQQSPEGSAPSFINRKKRSNLNNASMSMIKRHGSSLASTRNLRQQRGATSPSEQRAASLTSPFTSFARRRQVGDYEVRSGSSQSSLSAQRSHSSYRGPGVSHQSSRVANVFSSQQQHSTAVVSPGRSSNALLLQPLSGSSPSSSAASSFQHLHHKHSSGITPRNNSSSMKKKESSSSSPKTASSPSSMAQRFLSAVSHATSNASFMMSHHHHSQQSSATMNGEASHHIAGTNEDDNALLSAADNNSDFHYLDGVKEMMAMTVRDVEKMRRDEMKMMNENEQQEEESDEQQQEQQQYDPFNNTNASENDDTGTPPKKRRHTLQNASFGGQLILDCSFAAVGHSDDSDSDSDDDGKSPKTNHHLQNDASVVESTVDQPEQSRGSVISSATTAPRGLDSIIEKGGSNLSSGERQLLCLCRALLKKCPIILLDEATASCDPETTDRISKVVRSEFKECTIITIAHRIGTIIDSDQIIVMSQGEVLESGSPAELLEKENDGKNFRSMCEKLGPFQYEKLRAVAFQ